MKKTLLIVALSGLFIACNAQEKRAEMKSNLKVEKSEAEWKEQLTPEQFYVLREKGTERPHTGEYDMFFKDGIYHCKGCNAELFSSETKFDAHCGWPSFDQAISDSAIIEKTDVSHGMVRTEVMCGKCGGHLGHVFNDGPTETGLRYCINSVSLGFDEEAKKEDKK
jgi:peptide-methionine (R)-S-oxide reductase